MAKGKRSRTKEEVVTQRHRTAKNQIKRFTRNLVERPDHPHGKVWGAKIAKYESALK